MKPQYLKIAGKGMQSFSIRHDKLYKFRGNWHYHPELELHYVIKGEGIRFVGDSVDKFSEGELILLGENLPHCWQSADAVNVGLPDNEFEVIVLQFLPNCMGAHLLNMPEANPLIRLFERAKNGMKIQGHTKEKVVSLMLELSAASNMDRLILFFKIMNELAESSEYGFLTQSKNCYHARNESDMARVNQVYAYSMANYMQKITLNQMAGLCNLTVTSFCRFFRTMYRKSYYDFLTEIRVSKACLMIIDSDLTIESICNLCGYHNISNFYRHFKNITGMTPYVYKRKFARRNIAA